MDDLGVPHLNDYEASTGLHPWYPSFLRRNPPKHPSSLALWSRFSFEGSRLDRGEYSTGRAELRRVRPSHSSMGLRPWSSAKADKWVLLVDRSAMDYISKAIQIYAIAEEGVET